MLKMDYNLNALYVTSSKFHSNDLPSQTKFVKSSNSATPKSVFDHSTLMPTLDKYLKLMLSKAKSSEINKTIARRYAPIFSHSNSQSSIVTVIEPYTGKTYSNKDS